MYKQTIYYSLIKLAKEQPKPIQPLHIMAKIRAQNNGLNPNMLLTDPGKAVDVVMQRLKNKQIPCTQYKEAEAEPEPQPNTFAAQFAKQHQFGTRKSLLEEVSKRFAFNHSTPNTDMLKGEGQHVLSMNTKQNLTKPGNIGNVGRGTKSKLPQSSK